MDLKMITILALAILFFIPLVIAPLVDNPNLPLIRPTEPSISSFDNNTANVNNSQYWQGHTGTDVEWLQIDHNYLWTLQGGNGLMGTPIAQYYHLNLLEYNNRTYLYNQTFNPTGYAQYQFGSNNFNGSGNFTTSGNITAKIFISNIATGTQPYATTSTTLNTNLNADMCDSQHLGTVNTPTFQGLTISNGGIILNVDNSGVSPYSYPAFTTSNGGFDFYESLTTNILTLSLQSPIEFLSSINSINIDNINFDSTEAIPSISSVVGNEIEINDKLSVNGNLNVTTNVTANKFIGNGSLLTGIPQYQFNSNNFNGSGNFTTTGQGRFNNGVGVNILPNTNVGININLSGNKIGVNNTIILTGEQSAYGFYNTMKTNNPSSSNRFLYGVYQDFNFNTDGDGDVSFPIGYFNYNNLNLSGDIAIVYGDYNNYVITGAGSSVYGTRNVINAKGTSSQGLGYSQSISAMGNNSVAYGFDVGVTAIAGATGQTLKGVIISTAGQTQGNTTTITGIEVSHSAVLINNPTVNQIGLKLSWNGLGTDVNNKKWALYNDGTLNNASKIFLGKDNVKTYFGTGYDASIYYDGTNMIFNTNETGKGLAWFSRNVSATGYITRTSVFDKSKGEALSYIKDADSYKTPIGDIKHNSFYGGISYQVTDFSKPIINIECFNQTIENKEIEFCHNVTTYPYTKTEEAVDLEKEIDVLRQGTWELNQIIKEQNNTINKLINKTNELINKTNKLCEINKGVC